jgi:hypothetical protein
MIVPAELPRNTGTDDDGVAQREADHFEKCPVYSQWFDMRDLVQVAEHIHDGNEIEVLEVAAARGSPALKPAGVNRRVANQRFSLRLDFPQTFCPDCSSLRSSPSHPQKSVKGSC